MADNDTNQDRPRGVEALKQHVSENKADVALWASRVLTIIFAIGYVLPIFGYVDHDQFSIHFETSEKFKFSKFFKRFFFSLPSLTEPPKIHSTKYY